MLTVVVAAAPSLFLLTFFYLKDRYEREPLQHILIAFGLGLYSMVAAHGMATTAESWVPAVWLRTGGEPEKLFDAFVLSGCVEELAKWVELNAAVYHWDEFDEPIELWLEAPADVLVSIEPHLAALADDTIADTLNRGAPPPDAVSARQAVSGGEVGMGLRGRGVTRRD